VREKYSKTYVKSVHPDSTVTGFSEIMFVHVILLSASGSVFVLLGMPPWHELDMESVSMELRKPGGGLPLDGLPHPFDTILQAGLVVDPSSRHLTLDQLHNTLGIALVVASTQVLTCTSLKG